LRPHSPRNQSCAAESRPHRDDYLRAEITAQRSNGGSGTRQHRYGSQRHPRSDRIPAWLSEEHKDCPKDDNAQQLKYDHRHDVFTAVRRIAYGEQN